MSYEYSDKLNSVARDRYLAKLQAAGLELCPYKLEAGRWSNDPTKWPDVQYPDIYSYLVETPGVFTKEAMKNYKSLEAHNYFVSGWVYTVLHMKTTSGLFLFKADVKPSQRLNDEPHHPWLIVGKEGNIVAAHCDCMAGLGESCSHVGALLFKIEAAVRLGYTSRLCTEEPCKWNQCFTKKVEPATIHEIQFYTNKTKEKLKASKKRKCKEPNVATEFQQDDFLQSLKHIAPKCICLSSFGNYCEEFIVQYPTVKETKLPINLRTLFHPDNISSIEKAKEEATAKLAVSNEQIEYVIESTSKQSDSPVWHEMRIGRITASKVHSVLHTNMHKPSTSVLKMICTPTENLSNVPAIQWGRKHESTAAQHYAEKMKTEHEELTVSTTGLWLCQKHSYIGASPDSLVKCKCCGSGIVEIKCPYKHKESDINTVLSDKAGCLERDLHPKLKKTHSYYTQMQTQMFVCNVQYGDFVFWTTKTLIICRVARDNDFISHMEKELSSFWHRHCLPELLTRKNELGTIETTSDDVLYPYCICKEEKGGEMIGCDNPNCKIKWYHLTCLNKKRAPKKEWVCKKCQR